MTGFPFAKFLCVETLEGGTAERSHLGRPWICRKQAAAHQIFTSNSGSDESLLLQSRLQAAGNTLKLQVQIHSPQKPTNIYCPTISSDPTFINQICLYSQHLYTKTEICLWKIVFFSFNKHMDGKTLCMRNAH